MVPPQAEPDQSLIWIRFLLAGQVRLYRIISGNSLHIGQAEGAESMDGNMENVFLLFFIDEVDVVD